MNGSTRCTDSIAASYASRTSADRYGRISIALLAVIGGKTPLPYVEECPFTNDKSRAAAGRRRNIERLERPSTRRTPLAIVSSASRWISSQFRHRDPKDLHHRTVRATVLHRDSQRAGVNRHTHVGPIPDK